jgi:hypothetical protein
MRALGCAVLLPLSLLPACSGRNPGFDGSGLDPTTAASKADSFGSIADQGELLLFAVEERDMAAPRAWADRWRFEGRSDAHVTFSATSDVFRPSLLVTGDNGLRWFTVGKESGDGWEAVLEVTMPDAQAVQVFVSGAEAGVYRLSASGRWSCSDDDVTTACPPYLKCLAEPAGASCRPPEACRTAADCNDAEQADCPGYHVCSVDAGQTVGICGWVCS